MLKAMRRFAKDKSGAFVLQFGLLIIPLLVCVGLAVDGGRVFLTRFALNSALDAAGLALGSANLGTEAERDAYALRFVQQNFNMAGATGLVVDSTVVNGEITVTGSVDMQTFFMPIVGTDSANVGASTLVRTASNGLMVSLVLDNTGSMWSDNNIEDLRTSTENLVDQLFDGETVHDHLRIAVVPYSTVVNLGAEADEPGIMNTPLPASRTSTNVSDQWWGCVMARAGDLSKDDTAPTDASTRWDAYWWASESSNDYNINNTSTINPGPGNGSQYTGPNLYCPSPIVPLTNVKSEVDAGVAAMQAGVQRGGTLTDVGIMWGWRTLTPGLPYDESTEVDPLNGDSLWDSGNWRKAIVIMTDGVSQFYKMTWNSGPNSENHSVDSDFNAYGHMNEGNALDIFGSSNMNSMRTKLNTRIEQMCTDIKGQGITVYTVVFGGSVNSTTRDMYERCATTNGHYHFANSDAALDDAFEEIGDDLSRLRLAR